MTDPYAHRFYPYATLWCTSIAEAETMLAEAVQTTADSIRDHLLMSGHKNPRLKVIFEQEPEMFDSPVGIRLVCRFGVFEAMEIQ